jgi:hypothetical protein
MSDRHSATSTTAATLGLVANGGQTQRLQIPTGDWRQLLDTDLSEWRRKLDTDLAAAATEFVCLRQQAGVPRRGAGTDFARLAHAAGSPLSARQLRDYVTQVTKHSDSQ